MKLVYICSRYRADATHTIEEAVDSALYACSVAISKGYAPIAPHLYLPRCLDDNEPAERASNAVSQLIMSPIREHSRKPDEVRDRIVELLGDLPRIELFAREAAPGWDCWGKEAPINGVFRYDD